MENILQSSSQTSMQNFRTRVALIEFIELAVLGFVFWCFGAIVAINNPDINPLDQIIFLGITEGILLGSWAIYNGYIRVARAGGKIVDVGIWVIASILTSSYTFWAWTILDLNRILISKLFHRGDAPVEFAWSAHSKKVRKVWEQTRKASSV